MRSVRALLAAALVVGASACNDSQRIGDAQDTLPTATLVSATSTTTPAPPTTLVATTLPTPATSVPVTMPLTSLQPLPTYAPAGTPATTPTPTAPPTALTSPVSVVPVTVPPPPTTQPAATTTAVTAPPATPPPATPPPATPAPTTAAPAEPTTICARTNIDFAALRAGPALSADLLGEIPPGDCTVIVLDPNWVRTGGIRWINVTWNGIDGWTALSNMQ